MIVHRFHQKQLRHAVRIDITQRRLAVDGHQIRAHRPLPVVIIHRIFLVLNQSIVQGVHLAEIHILLLICFHLLRLLTVIRRFVLIRRLAAGAHAQHQHRHAKAPDPSFHLHGVSPFQKVIFLYYSGEKQPLCENTVHISPKNIFLSPK